MVDLTPEPGIDERLPLEELPRGGDEREGRPRGLGIFVDLCGGAAGDPLVDERRHEVVVLGVEEEVREARVVDEFRVADALVDGRRLAGHGGEADVAIGALVDAPDGAGLVPGALGVGAAQHRGRAEAFEARRLRLLHGDVDPVANAGAARAEEGRGGGGKDVEAGLVVGLASGRLQRRKFGFATEHHLAAGGECG